MNFFQSAAFPKYACANYRDIARNLNAFQTAASAEHISGKSGQSTAKLDLFEACTILKTIISRRCDTVCDGNIGQCRTAVKRTCTDTVIQPARSRLIALFFQFMYLSPSSSTFFIIPENAPSCIWREHFLQFLLFQILHEHNRSLRARRIALRTEIHLAIVGNAADDTALYRPCHRRLCPG